MPQSFDWVKFAAPPMEWRRIKRQITQNVPLMAGWWHIIDGAGMVIIQDFERDKVIATVRYEFQPHEHNNAYRSKRTSSFERATHLMLHQIQAS